MTFVLCVRLFGSAAARAYLALTLPLQVFMVFRLDMLGVALTLLSLELARRRKASHAGLVFGAAILFKFWPTVCLPLLWVKAGRRGVAFALLGTGVGLAVWLALGGTEGIRYVSSFRGATGWQVESTIGAAWSIVADQLPRFELGSMRVGRIVGWEPWALRAVLLTALVLIWRKSSREDHVDAAGMPTLAAVATLIATAPVASAQYVAWLMPWCAVAVVERRRTATVVASAGAALLSAAAFMVYWDVAGGLVTLEWLSAARALCIVALPICWLVERPERAS